MPIHKVKNSLLAMINKFLTLVVFTIFSFFTVYSQQHSIVSFSPQNASSGETVIITGTNFSTITAVKFGGVNAASFEVVSPTIIKAVVGNGNSGSLVVSKTGVAQQNVGRNGFSYSSIPTVTEIISDFNTFWKTGVYNNSSVLPNTSHNLLSFKYNDVTYSTGVNDNALSSNGVVYSPAQFKALPVSIDGLSSGSSLYVAMASKIDGTSVSALFNHDFIKNNTIQSVLTDGINGLDLGTGYTNLPSNAVSNYMISAIEPSKISDQTPDILITQIAELGGQPTDTYRFVDENGNIVGNSYSINLSKIAPLGKWAADMFSVNNGVNFSTAKPNRTRATNTNRQLRLVAFKLSDFGISASNYTQIRKLEIVSSGVSDVAFVAYNTEAITASSAITINTSSSSTAVCSSGGYAYIEAEVTAPYGSTLIYQWEQSSDNGLSWYSVENNSNFNGATTKSLTLYNAFPNDKFRLKVTEVERNYSVTSCIVGITEGTNVALTGTLNPSNIGVCILSNSIISQLSVLPVGGSGTYSYQWKVSNTVNGTYSDIPGATARTYSPDLNVAGVKYYKVLINSGCRSNLSKAASVTVKGSTILSVLDGITCPNNSAVLSAQSTGGTINWYATEAFGSNVGTGVNFNTPNISTATTYYVGASANGCNSVRVPVIASIENEIQLSDLSVVVSNGCFNNSNIVTVNSSSLVQGTYSLNYSIAGTNNLSNLVAEINFDGHIGSFILPSLPNFGDNNILTIEKISSVSYQACPKVVNVLSSPFSYNDSVSLTAVHEKTFCSNTLVVSLVNDFTASNASSLYWTSNGSGTFINNNTTNVFVDCAYLPSNSDISNGSVILTLNATGRIGCSNSSAKVTINFSQLPVGGDVLGSSTTCSNINSTTFELSNYFGSIKKWQLSSSADFASNVRDTNVIENTFSLNNITNTTYVRAIVSNAYCDDVYSSVGSILVNPPSIGGQISGNSSFCAGSNNNTTFTLNGYSGSIIKWQKSTNADFAASVEEISSTSSTITFSNVTQTTYVRALIQNGTCPFAFSNNGVIFVTPTPIGGTASSNSSVCLGSSAVLTLNDYVGSVARWQKCSNANFTSGISNIYVASPTATVANVTAPFFYRAVVTNGTCGTKYSQPVYVSIASVPSTPIIVGSDTVCSGNNSTLLTATNAVGSFQWQSSSNGITYTNLAGETNSTLSQTNLTAKKYYKVVVSNGMCKATSASAAIFVYGNMGTLGYITGPSNVYGMDSTVYSVPSVANVMHYIWTMPSGMTLTSSSNGNSVNVAIADYFSIGTISVKAVGYCSQSNTRTLSVRSSTSVPSVPVVPLYGNSTICITSSITQSFSIDPVQGATNYTWTLPVGATFSNDHASNSVEVIFNSSFTNGTISVVAKNSSGTIIAKASKLIGSLDKPNAIVGPNNLCGKTTATYSIQTPIEGITYNWTLPAGLSIISGAGSSTITVSISATSPTINGYVRAQAVGACGTSAFTSFSVYKLSINGNLLGPEVVCGASTNIVLPNGSISTTPSSVATYSIMAVAGATNYAWNVPPGVSIASGQGTNSINVSFGSNFDSGNITVKAYNADSSCSSLIKSKSVVIASASITGPTSLCGLSSATFSVPSEVASGFNWKIPSWMTLMSGSLTSNSITVALPSVICSDSIVSVSLISDCGGSHNVSMNVGCTLLSKINDTQNNTIVSPSTIISANPKSSAIAYRFRLSNGDSTFILDKAINTFSFSEVNGLVLGTNYTVDVAVKFVGTDFGQFGCPAIIKTKATKIQTSQCGAIIPSSTTLIYCDAVSGATGYKFEIKGVGLDASNPNVVGTYELTTNNRYFMLSQVPRFSYGVDYAVRVAIKNPGSTSYGQYGETCTVTLKGTKVQATQCGTSVLANTMIYADALTGATYYKFEVTGLGLNLSAPLELATAEIATTNKYFTLSQLPGLVLGETYSIRVSTKNGDNGVYGSYDDACSVTTKTTQIQASQCGITGVLPTTVINADILNSASTYVFEITGPGLTTPVVLSSANRFFSFSQIPAALYGETYSIRVAAKTATGNVGPYGSSCTATLKTTQLQSSQCSTGAPIGFATLIYCDAVSGATGYRFEISNQDGSIIATLDKSSTARSFRLSEIPSLGAGVFNVRVAIKNVQGVFGTFGSTCQVMTAASIAMNNNNNDSANEQNKGLNTETNTNGVVEESSVNTEISNTDSVVLGLVLKNDWNVQFNKNPFETSFKLILQSSDDAIIEIDIFDMSGKVVESVQTSIEELDSIEFGKTVNAGVYLVKVSQGKNSKTLRLIKN